MRKRPLLNYFLSLTNQIIWWFVSKFFKYCFRLLRCLCILLEIWGTICQINFCIWGGWVLTCIAVILLDIVRMQTGDDILVRFCVMILDSYFHVVNILLIFIRFRIGLIWVKCFLFFRTSSSATIRIHLLSIKLTFLIFRARGFIRLHLLPILELILSWFGLILFQFWIVILLIYNLITFLLFIHILHQ